MKILRHLDLIMDSRVPNLLRFFFLNHLNCYGVLQSKARHYNLCIEVGNLEAQSHLSDMSKVTEQVIGDSKNRIPILQLVLCSSDHIGPFISLR